MVNQYPNYSYPNYPNYPTYPSYQQPIQQPSIQKQILDWVGSEKEAVDYPLTAGQSIFLMNQMDDYLYAKSVDQLGKVTFIKKKLVDESDNQEKKIDLKEYIRREELEDLITDKIQKEVEKRVSQISFKPIRKKSADDEE